MRYITQLLLVLFAIISTVQSINQSLLNFRTYGPAPVSPLGQSLIKQFLKMPNNQSYPNPAPLSAPVLKIGLTHSISGVRAAPDGVGFADLFQFYADITNMHGGIYVNGEQYQISIIMGDDQSSSTLMMMMYDDLLHAQGLSLFLGPFGDDLQEKLIPLMINQSASLVTATALDPDTFKSLHQSMNQSINQSNGSSLNMYQIIPPASHWHTVSLNTINQLAKDSAIKPSNEALTRAIFHDDSIYGISTVCLYSTADKLGYTMYEGVLEWITRENELRIAQGAPDDKLIRVLVDQPINDTDIIDFTTYWMMCPDGTSLAVMPMSRASVVELERSGRSFSAVLALNNGDEFVLWGADKLKQAAGWHLSLHFLDSSNAQSMKGQPTLTLEFLIMQYEVYRRAVPSMTSIYDLSVYGFARIAELSYLLTALNASTSLTVEGIREGMFSLSGQTGLLGLIDFNQLTGVNDAHEQGLGSSVQTDRNGKLVTEREYPYRWEWLSLRVVPGTHINHEIDPLRSIIGVMCAVVSVWVGSILIDQSIWVKEKKGSRSWEFMLWTAFAFEAIGGLGIFGAHLMWATGMIPQWPDFHEIKEHSDWSFGGLSIAWLLAIGLFALALSQYTLSWSGSLFQSRVSKFAIADQEVQQTLWTWSDELFFLCRCLMSCRGILTSILTVAAVMGGRLLVLYSWIANLSFTIPVWSWITSAVVCLICLPISLASFRYGVRLRVPGVLLFALGVTLDWAITSHAVSFSYDPNPMRFYGRITDAVVMSSLAATLLSGVGTAAICLLFVGIQFMRMRLSHREVLNTVRTQEKALDAATSRLEVMTSKLSKERTRVGALQQSMDCMTLMSALPHQWALPFVIFNVSDEVARRNSLVRHPSATRSGNQSIDVSHNMHNLTPASAFSKSKSRVRKVAPSSSALGRIPSIDASSDQSVVTCMTSTSEESILSCLIAQGCVALLPNDTAFSLTAPLFDKSFADRFFPLTMLSLKQVISHPCCIELLKQEMLRFHCVENLTFWLHARKYRTVTDPRLRSVHAWHIVDTYIAEGAAQQINLSTQQRKAIIDVLDSNGTMPRLMFQEAEKECLLLIQTNQWDRFTKSINYRLCCWIYSVIDYRLIGQSWLAVDHLRNDVSSMQSASSNGASLNQVNQIDNQSTNQSIIQTHNQSTNQSFIQTNNQLTIHTSNPSIIQSPLLPQ